jgi:hypothetical protein
VIPALLWRCPLCAAHDALVHKRPFMGPEVVNCAACRARWRVRRVRGDDFYLRLDKPGSSSSLPAGQDQSLASWYDRMKSGLRLQAMQAPSFPLNPHETLYLASQAAELWIAAEDPLITGKTANGYDKISPSGEDLAVMAGCGRIYLTNQRLAWQSRARCQDFPLPHIQGAYAIVNLGLAVTAGMRLVFFRFLHESPLKWVSYFSLVAEQLQAETGRRIATSHW